MKAIHACWVLLLVVLAGCETKLELTSADSPGNRGQQILVLIPQQQFGSALLGSKRYASGRGYSQVPIHVRSHIDRLADAVQVKEVDGWPIPALESYCIVFELSSDQDVDAVMDTLSRQAGVTLVQPMNYFEGLVSGESQAGDPYAEIQFGRDLSLLQDLHRYSLGENVRIGIIDSSVDQTHPDLVDQISDTVDFVNVSGPQDKLHGTAMAGIIAARLNNGEGGFGIAPGAQLLVYGVCKRDLGGNTVCNTFDLARGLARAMEDRVDIINLSLAGPHDPLLELLLRELLRLDTIVVAAVNPGHPENSFPASMPGILAVGEQRKNNQSGDSQPPDILPVSPWYLSSERMSTRAGGGYQFFYGNSVSTAGITGLAALIRSCLSREETRQWLEVATSGNCNLRNRSGEENSDFDNALAMALGCEFAHGVSDQTAGTGASPNRHTQADVN